MDDFVDVYAVLGVPPGATQQDLKAAHRALVRRHHPDLVPPADREAATCRVREVNAAYALVRTGEDRARYDRLRRLRAAREAAADVSYRAGRLVGRWLAGDAHVRSGTGRRSRT